MSVEALKALCETARETAGIPTQTDVDQRAAWSVGTYSAVINGRKKTPSFELLHDIARVLHLTEEGWAHMCSLARGQNPPYALYEHSGRTVDPAWLSYIHGISHPAYVIDPSWNLLAWNATFAAIYEGRDWPDNMMRWMLLSDDARGNPAQPDLVPILTDWETAWAPYVLPQLRAARAHHPKDQTLEELETAVLRDPRTGPLYAHRAYDTAQPDGSVRPQYWPPTGEHGWVRICAAELLGCPGARFMGTVFTPGPMPAADTCNGHLAPGLAS
ncbi:XRE family transcriptional regulator [Streptomyces sp. NPDC059740]|uniref:helix-turn-helix domain-containing protein n=1 Tax=Streptomyces sp. NPDC059740 TaxID=3346926 RepID=UPI00364AD3D8